MTSGFLFTIFVSSSQNTSFSLEKAQHSLKWMIHVVRAFIIVKNFDLRNLQIVFESRASQILSKLRQVLEMNADIFQVYLSYL